MEITQNLFMESDMHVFLSMLLRLDIHTEGSDSHECMHANCHMHIKYMNTKLFKLTKS